MSKPASASEKTPATKRSRVQRDDEEEEVDVDREELHDSKRSRIQTDDEEEEEEEEYMRFAPSRSSLDAANSDLRYYTDREGRPLALAKAARQAPPSKKTACRGCRVLIRDILLTNGLCSQCRDKKRCSSCRALVSSRSLQGGICSKCRDRQRHSAASKSKSKRKVHGGDSARTKSRSRASRSNNPWIAFLQASAGQHKTMEQLSHEYQMQAR